MKALKNTLIVGSVFLFGILVTPVAAQFDSLMGELIEGTEFVKIVDSGGLPTYIHKNEVAVVRKKDNYTYQIMVKTGTAYSITKAQFELLETKLDADLLA